MASSTKVFAKAPCPALQPYVKHFLVVDFAAPVRDSHLPDTGLVAAFPYQGHCQLEDGSKAPRAGLTGLWSRIRHHVHSRDNSVVVVAFTAIGASVFFRDPLDELAESVVAMNQLIGGASSLGLLDEQLAEAVSHLRRVEIVENFLVKRARW